MWIKLDSAYAQHWWTQESETETGGERGAFEAGLCSSWANALQSHAIQRKLFSGQRGVVLRIVSAYRTMSSSAVLVLASVPPIHLLAEERKETFQLRKELTCLTNLQEIARAKEAIRKGGRRRLVKKWKTRWHGEQTGRWTTWLNRKHREVGFYLAQAFSFHDCFNA